MIEFELDSIKLIELLEVRGSKGQSISLENNLSNG